MEEVAPLIAAPFFFHWYVIGAVPVAATLNVAVCPAAIFALAGCVEIVGATALGDVDPLPVPLSATEVVEPLERMKISVPEYACAADGLNVTEPVRLWPGFKLTGKVGPEKENWATEEETLEIVMLCRLSFVMVTVCDRARRTHRFASKIDGGRTNSYIRMRHVFQKRTGSPWPPQLF